MKKRYILPIIMFLLVSAAKVTSEKYAWNFKDYTQIEYEASISMVNRTDYANQTNGLKLKANYVLKVIDSAHANLFVVNKKIIESTNDSTTTYDEVHLEDALIYENYNRNGQILGRVSDDATALKDILFPVLESKINVGDTIKKNTEIPFSLGSDIVDLKGENIITKISSIDGIDSFTSKLDSPRFPLDASEIPNMMIFFDGNSSYKFDNNKGVFINEDFVLNFKVIGEIDGRLSNIFTVEIIQQIQLKNLK